MMAAYLLLVPGCGANKEKMQTFVDGYLGVVNKLQSKPEIGQQGREAYTTYASSGYTDLESAEKAKKSYEDTLKLDKECLVELDALEKPDEDAEWIADGLYKGVQTIDNSNTEFKNDLEMARDQTVEERSATAQNIQPKMDLWKEGLEKIIESMGSLDDYVKNNGLEGASEIQEWLDTFNEELEMFKQYTSE